MKRIIWIFLFLLLAGTVSANAQDVQLTLTPATATSPNGGTVTFSATVKNATGAAVYLNQIFVSFDNTGQISVNPTPFYINFSGRLAAGQSVTSQPLFTATSDTLLTAGIYTATVTLYGGADASAFSNLAQQDFRVNVVQDTTPPTTTITGGPINGGIVCNPSVTFAFAGTDNLSPAANLRYQYRVDSGTPQGPFTNTSVTLTNLTEGLHSFSVAAIDEAGNTSPNPAYRNFYVSLTPAVLSAIAAAPRDYKATLTWVTNKPATSQVEYGLTSSYGTLTPLDSNTDGAHLVTIDGLTPLTTYHYRLHSSDGCREVVSSDMTFKTTDILKPNLTITSFTFPATGKALDTISVSWTVFNNGPGDSSQTWSDALYLSTTATLDASATPIATFGPKGPLTEFGSYTQTKSIQLPLEPAGTYYLIVKTDANNAVSETSKDDNVLAQPINYLKLSNLVAAPDQIPLSLNPGVAVQGTISLGNLSSGTLTGIKAVVEGASPNLTIQVTAPSSLNTLKSAAAQYTITASNESVLQNAPKIHFTTNEGEEAFVTLNVTVIPRNPQLVLAPVSFAASMLRPPDASDASMSDPKYRTLTEIVITNTGSVAATGLIITLPSNTPWMSLVTPNMIDAIPPGGQARIALSLRPTATQALGHYTGTLAVNGDNVNFQIPYDFNCISAAKGTLSIVAEDEYSYFAMPPTYVANAQVVLKDAQTGAIIAQGVTDMNGALSLPNVPENYYNMEVTADKHETSRSTVQVLGGQTSPSRPFLSRQLVTYDWSVIPVDTADQYIITIDATFETNVPAPVVTVSPAYLDVRTLTFDSNGKAVINFVITNHGLVAANTVSFIPQNTLNGYDITVAMQDLGTLPALTTVVVPVTISKSGKLDGGSCQVSIDLLYAYICGKLIGKLVPAILTTGGCPPGAIGGGGGGGGAFGGAGASGSGPSVTLPDFCDPCTQAILKCIFESIVGCTPYSCAYAWTFGGCLGWLTSSGPNCTDLLDCAINAFGCALCKPCFVTPLICLAYTIPKACPSKALLEEASARQFLLNADNDAMTIVNFYSHVFGDQAWMTTNPADDALLQQWVQAFVNDGQPNSDGGRTISPAETAALLQLSLPRPLVAADAQKLIARWNRTADYYSRGIHTIADVPPGGDTDFIDREQFLADGNEAVNAEKHSQTLGYTNSYLYFYDAAKQYINTVVNASTQEGICARVKVQLDQSVTLTRTSFKATLSIANTPQNVPLQNVQVTLKVQDSAFNTVPDDTFGIVGPTLTNIGDVSGNGVVNPGVTASAQWLLTPTRSAAPLNDTVYYVGGTLSYTQGGTLITIPLFPTSITVKPNPFLKFHYFWQHDVYSDDPFTPNIIEPSEPYALGLIVLNGGAGTARNLQITSSQPKIVENEKGLLIDFKIIGSQVNADPVTPSLMVNLGNIDPGQTSVAKWLMTSSLAGKFIDYSASFKHVDDLGNPKTSLLDSVKIDALEHVVRVDNPASADDGKPDFLAIVTPDLAYKLYNSDGSDEATGTPVTPHLTDATVDGLVTPTHTNVHLTVPNVGTGWVFIRTDDPGQAKYALLRVIRSDGREVRINDNAWLTNRLIHPKGQNPYQQARVYLFDKNSTGSYTLVYGPPAPVHVSPGGGKLLADGAQVILDSVIVTANLPGCMYVEAQDRSSGVKVVTNTAAEGTIATVSGVIHTGANGERYVDASNVDSVGAATIDPLGLTTRSFYGGDNSYDATSGQGQRGMTGGAGLNPVGLLTQTVGLVTARDAMGGTFQITDGYGRTLKVVLPNGVAVPALNSFAEASGAVSMEAAGGYYPVLKPRRASDLNYNPAATLQYAFTTPDSLLHSGQNRFSLPGIPFDPYPPRVLTNFDPGNGSGLQGRLYRFDAGTQQTIFWDAGIGFAAFGNLLLGDGYQLTLRNGETDAIAFSGLLANFADAYISLPALGATLLGHPFAYPVKWSDVLVTNGVKTVSLADAAQTEFPPWLNSKAQYFDSATQTTRILGLPTDNPDSTQLLPWFGYYVFSSLDNLALIVPTSIHGLSGVITLEGVPNLTATAIPIGPVTFVFRPTDGTAPFTESVTLNGDGSFLLTDVPAKKYTLWIKAPKWLAKAIPVDLTGRGVNGFSITLRSGDADGNNIVDIGDFGLLVSAYGSVRTDPSSGYNPSADLNADGFVDVADFGLLVANYGAKGDP